MNGQRAADVREFATVELAAIAHEVAQLIAQTGARFITVWDQPPNLHMRACLTREEGLRLMDLAEAFSLLFEVRDGAAELVAVGRREHRARSPGRAAAS